MGVLKRAVDQGIATLTLSRPEVGNALNPELIDAITLALAECAADDAVRVVVIAGEGRAFCAGADLKWMSHSASLPSDENQREVRRLAEMFRLLYELPKPTIARVHGSTYGGGIGLVAACDLSIALCGAMFCFSEVRLGLLPAVISPYVLRRMNPSAAKRFFLTGQPFLGEEAWENGLVSQSAEDVAQLDRLVESWCADLIKGAPGALTATKQLFDIASRPIDDELISRIAGMLASLRVSEEGLEGIGAFLEKRVPRWRA